MTKHGSFFWNELNTWDVERAKAFYAETLGWTYEEMPNADGGIYYLCKCGDEMVAGMLLLTEPQFTGVPEHWFCYVAVKDVDKSVEDVRAAGGKVLREPWDIPEVGRMAVISDANGAILSYMTPLDIE